MDTKSPFRKVVKYFIIVLVIISCRESKNDGVDVSIAKNNQNRYWGIWFEQLFKNGESKYSGGMATYSEKHRPIAIYSKEFNKTFFVFGSINKQTKSLVICIGYFDHSENTFSDPVKIWEKPTNNPHENAIISMDSLGYLYVFANAHGNNGESRIFKSSFPGDITSFKENKPVLLIESELPSVGKPFHQFSYMQMWYTQYSGFLGVFTRYYNGPQRVLCFAKSPDGITWTDFKILAAIEEGSYHISSYQNGKLFVAFDHHPKDRGGDGIDFRSNLYLIHSNDQGNTWKSTQNNSTLYLPLNTVDNPAMVLNTDQKNQNLYLKDLVIGPDEKPIVLFSIKDRGGVVTSSSINNWYLLEWSTGKSQSHFIGKSDHDFDMGAMRLKNGNLKVLSATVLDNGLCGGILNVTNISTKNYSILDQWSFSSYDNTNYYKTVLNGTDEFSFLWSTGDPSVYSDCHIYYMSSDSIKPVD